MSERVGWAIIGLGNIAARVATAVRAVEDAELAHVSSRDAARAAAFAREHGAVRSSAGLEALLSDDSVDVVYVATPNALHADQTIRSLEAGKHVLVEKPMATSLSEAEAMLAAARAAARQLGVGFHLRFHPVHRELRQRLAAGDCGEVVYVTAQWGSNPDLPSDLWHVDPRLAAFGSLGGLGVHMLDLVPWLLGDVPVAVTALNDGVAHGPVEFFTLASLRFEGGAFGSVVSSRRLPFSTQSVTVYGSEGRLRARGTLGVDPAGELEITTAEGTDVIRPTLPDLYEQEVRALTDALRGGEAFPVSAEDGVRSMALMEAITRAAQSGVVPARGPSSAGRLGAEHD